MKPCSILDGRVGLLVVALGLLAAVFAAHSGALDGGFHYDDRAAVRENLAIRAWRPLVYLTSPRAVSSEVDAAGYRPLTVATFAVNYAIGRLDPFGYLVVNFLLHALVSWMVFLVGRRVLGDPRWAGLAAAVFLLHPVNAEAVNYVVARSSLLSTLGALIALWAYLRRLEQGNAWWAVIGATAFAAALLSKESAMALVLPLILCPLALEFDRASGGRAARRVHVRQAIIAAWPWLLVVPGYLAAWWAVAGANMQTWGAVAAYPWWTFGEIVGRSLRLWVWPWPLGLDHPLTFVRAFDPVLASALVAGGAALAAAAFVLGRRASWVPWALVWVLAGLLPLLPLPWMTVKGLLQENRLTFSAVALAWLTAAAVRWLIGSLQARYGAARRWVGAVPLVVVAGALLGAGMMDRARSAVWNDDLRLWHEVVDRSPDNGSAHLNLGVVYMTRDRYDLAEAEFRRALAISPDYTHGYYALGLLAFRRERYDEARELLQHAIAMVSDYPGLFEALGDVELKARDLDAAEAAFRRAVELHPHPAKAYAKLGLILQQRGDPEGAATFYHAALREDPHQTLARNNLGVLAVQRGDVSEALGQFKSAVGGDPDDLDAAYNYGAALDLLGRKGEAREVLQALMRRLSDKPEFETQRRAAQAILDRSVQ